MTQQSSRIKSQKKRGRPSLTKINTAENARLPFKVKAYEHCSAEKICSSRFKDGKRQYWVQWKGYEDQRDRTWEYYHNLVPFADMIKDYEERIKPQTSKYNSQTKQKFSYFQKLGKTPKPISPPKQHFQEPPIAQQRFSKAELGQSIQVNEAQFYKVQKILSKRIIKDQIEYLVSWKGYEGQDTWQPIQNVEHLGSLIEEFQGKSSKKSSFTKQSFIKMKNFMSKEMPQCREESITNEISKQEIQTESNQGKISSEKIDDEKQRIELQNQIYQDPFQHPQKNRQQFEKTVQKSTSFLTPQILHPSMANPKEDTPLKNLNPTTFYPREPQSISNDFINNLFLQNYGQTQQSLMEEIESFEKENKIKKENIHVRQYFSKRGNMIKKKERKEQGDFVCVSSDQNEE